MEKQKKEQLILPYQVLNKNKIKILILIIFSSFFILFASFLENNMNESNILLVATHINQNKKICVNLISKKKKCLLLKNQTIFISSFKRDDFLSLLDLLVLSKDTNFSILLEKREILKKQISTLKERYGFYKKIEESLSSFKIVEHEYEANVIVQFSPTIEINSFEYVIVLFKKKHEVWGIKFKIKDNEILATEIKVILN